MAGKRRGRGEGSLYAADGRWVGQLSVTIGGKRTRKAFYGATKDEVREQMRRYVPSAPVNHSTETVEQYLRRWLAEVARITLSPTTLALYEDTLRIHVYAFVGTVVLAQLTPSQLRTFFAQLETNGRSVRMRRCIYAVLRSALNEAVRMELLTKNPLKPVTPPKPIRTEMKVWNQEETQGFFEKTKDHPFFAAFVLGAGMGMRVGEILGLRWKNVDLAAGVLHVREQLLEVRGRIHSDADHPDGLYPPKRSSVRSVELPAFVISALRRQKERLLARGQAANQWVFPRKDGKPYLKNGLRKAFKIAAEEAGLPEIRLHDLRHTCATLLLAAGVNVKVVQERLGHSDIAITLGVYSHVLPNMQKEASDKMDGILRGVK